MKNCLFTLLVGLMITNVGAQNKVDLRLNQVSSSVDMSCFDIELSSSDKTEIKLAGQNFRIFFDANNVKLLDKSVKTFASQEAYSTPDIISTAQNGIGFFSLSLDARENNESVISLPSSGSWEKVASACFGPINERKFDLVWANDRTSHFASAQVALSEWAEDNKQVVLTPNMMIDYIGKEAIKNSELLSLNVYPNPVANHINVDIKGQFDEGMTIMITDVIGREVVYQAVEGDDRLYYDLSNWPSGRYKVELLNDSGQVLHSESVIKTLAKN